MVNNSYWWLMIVSNGYIIMIYSAWGFGELWLLKKEKRIRWFIKWCELGLVKTDLYIYTYTIIYLYMYTYMHIERELILKQ